MSHISIAATIDHIVKVAHLFNTSLGEHFTVVNGLHQLAINQNVEHGVVGSFCLRTFAKIMDAQIEAEMELTTGRVNEPVGDVVNRSGFAGGSNS